LNESKIVMTEQNQEAFLFQCLDKAVSKYSVESRQLKRWTYALRIAVLLLSACSMVLLGLNVKGDPDYLIWSRNVVLMLGALSTFLVGVSAFWNVESYWLKHKVIFARIRALRERVHFLRAKDGRLSPEQIEAAFGEYRAMMEDRIEYWEKVASKTTPNPALQGMPGDKAAPLP
jgi:hypothetical protein